MQRLMPYDGWWEHIYDDAKEEGKAFGFEIDVIYFSGFYSQGDGASWTGSVDVAKWLEKNKETDAQAQIVIELVEDGWVNKKLTISSNWRYSHAGSMSSDGLEVSPPDNNFAISKGIFEGASVSDMFESAQSLLDTLADDIVESAKDYAFEIYKRLQNEYEYLCSEECISEMCDANEYLFSEDGKHFV